MRLCGLRTWFLTLVFIALPALAQTPPECLSEAAAMEQSSAYLQAFTALPTPPFVPLITRGEARFVNTASLFATIIDVPEKSIIINEINELRFLPYTLAGTSLLLVLNRAPDFTAEKSRKVVSVARALNLRLSLVWVDDSAVPSQLLAAIHEIGGRVIRRSELTRAVFEKFCVASPA